jgi:hypothetical protein
MLKAVLLSTLVACLGAGSVVADEQVVTQLKNCGSEAKNAFGTHKEYPTINEGNGYVGFQTEDVDAGGTKERYTLANCATRKVVQLKAEYLLADSSKGLPPQGDLFAFVDSLRKASKLANEALLVTNGKRQGYEVIEGQLSEKGSEAARRGDCGCGIFYPETMY